MKSSWTKVSIFKVLGLRQRRERQFLFSIQREERQSRMEKIKDTTAASYNLDGNLFLQLTLRPLGAFVILFHLFGTLQSQKTKIFCFVCQFKPLKPNLYFEQKASHATHSISRFALYHSSNKLNNHFTFYNPTQYLFLFPSYSPKRKHFPY